MLLPTLMHHQKGLLAFSYFLLPCFYDTVLRKTPIFSISTSTTSPLFRYLGGSNPIPTPSHVPVAIISPAFKVCPFEIVEIISGISKIICFVLEDCLTSPFTLQEISRLSGLFNSFL